MLAAPARPLSLVLRECTAAAHGDVEKSPFLSRLVSGSLNRAAVADYAAQLWFVYSALEVAVREHSADPRLAVVADPRLERVGALERDLADLIGPQWRSCILPGPGAAAYVDRLAGLAEVGDVTGLIAHHYVRYLGDLSGGQLLARVLRERYRVGAAGLHFYDFREAGDPGICRAEYRRQLDSLALGEVDVSWLASSANEAFALNRGVCRDLAERHCTLSDRI
ncbi:biliverdin-producing heme oxygenase [Corynebacterium marinum]|uniref:heme oxygenase (biliverdin-producing) n=1 Tax=Corynebacterium marinum DSM 44953 TaxID=1224162 RepID=A0A0B6TN88_9CORY|nr:biliverdin-producing heme oxygenase [Corynebacterium marinum]AJK67734.1 heme oxygenase [Corynebacterium marinum DSM 44953]GGO12649.1 heme oxygenase [Corynebacterium marinum]